jgi:PHS family inorganic phosphate transporter-like MFS transporter
MANKSEGHPDEIARIQAKTEAETGLTQPKASFRDFIRHYSILKNGLILFGTAGSWFCLDVACKSPISCSCRVR